MLCKLVLAAWLGWICLKRVQFNLWSPVCSFCLIVLCCLYVIVCCLKEHVLYTTVMPCYNCATHRMLGHPQKICHRYLEWPVLPQRKRRSITTSRRLFRKKRKVTYSLYSVCIPNIHVKTFHVHVDMSVVYNTKAYNMYKMEVILQAKTETVGHNRIFRFIHNYIKFYIK